MSWGFLALRNAKFKSTAQMMCTMTSCAYSYIKMHPVVCARNVFYIKISLGVTSWVRWPLNNVTFDITWRKGKRPYFQGVCPPRNVPVLITSISFYSSFGLPSHLRTKKVMSFMLTGQYKNQAIDLSFTASFANSCQQIVQ